MTTRLERKPIMVSNQMHRLQSLIETEDPKAIPILIDCIGSSHQATVCFAAESIGVMAKKQKNICNIAVPELVDALASENANIRKSILNTLLLLDIPLCYSGAIRNVVRGDNKPFNRTLAKKIILNIMSNDSSVKYDNYSESRNTFKQSSVVYGEEQVTCDTSLIVNSVSSQKFQINDLNKDGPPTQENIELCEITNFVQHDLANLSDHEQYVDPLITDIDVAQQTGLLGKTYDSNITSILTSILRKRGISNFKDIMTEFQDIAGNTYCSNSVGSTLLMRDDFVKFSPSIYGLSEHLKGFGISTSDLLLNDYDCQLFIMARYAGEAYGSFRLWNPVMEYKWYQWLEKRSNEELRASFNYIATPEEWPVNKLSALELKDKIKKQADTYHFLKNPHYLGSSLPDIRSIYALIRYAKDCGSINWISANLVLGQPIDDYHIVVDIAFMVCIGAVEPANNWQMLHKAKNDVKDIEKKLSNMLHCGQGADWKSPAGDFLMDAFTLNINVNDMGWVNVSFLNSLFHNAPKSASTVNDQASEPTEKSFSLVTGAVQLSSSSSTCDLVKNEAKTEKAVTYRSAQSKVNHAAVIILDDLKLDPVSHQVWRSGIEIELTQKEYALLLYLMRHPNIVLSRKKINDNVFESATDQTTNIIDVYVNYLRKKVDNDFPTKLIHTVRGKGYILRTLSGDCVSYIGINTGDELPENHTDPGRGEVIYFDDLKLDPVNHWVWRAEKRIQVTAKEYSLLLYFMLNPDVVVSREMIYDNVFEDAIDRSSNIVDVYVNYLRNKVDKNFTSKLIHTVRGKGYILMSDNVEYLEREINIETERNESIQPNTVFQHVETQNTKSSNRKYEPSNVDGNNNDKGTKTLDSIIEDFF